MSQETFRIELPLFDNMNHEHWLSLAMYGQPLDFDTFFEGDAYDDLSDDSLDPNQKLATKALEQGMWINHEKYKDTLLSLAGLYVKEVGFLRQFRKLGMTSTISVTPKEIWSPPTSYNYSNDKGIWVIEYPSEELFWEELIETAREYGLQRIADTNLSYESGAIGFTSSTHSDGDGFGAELESRDDASMEVALQELAAEAIYNGEVSTAEKDIFKYSYGQIDGFLGFVYAARYGDIPDHYMFYSEFVDIPADVLALSDKAKLEWVESEDPLWKLYDNIDDWCNPE